MGTINLVYDYIIRFHPESYLNIKDIEDNGHFISVFYEYENEEEGVVYKTTNISLYDLTSFAYDMLTNGLIEASK